MRKLASFFIAIFLLVVAPLARGQYTIVQSSVCTGLRLQHIIQACAGNGNGGNGSCTLTIPQNSLMVVYVWSYGNLSGTPITDTFGVTWNLITSTNVFRSGGSNDEFFMYYAWSGSNSGSETVTANAVNSSTIIFDQIAGVLLNSAPDGFSSASGTASGSMNINTGNFTTTTANDFITSGGAAGFTASLGVGTGFTLGVGAVQNSSADYPSSTIVARLWDEFDFSTTPGTYAGLWTINSAFTWQVAAAAWKPAVTSSPNGYTAVCPFPSNNTSGHHIVAVAVAHGSALPGLTLSDSSANSYSLAAFVLSYFSTTEISIYVADTITSGANSVTAVCNSSDYAAVYIFEVAGTAATNAVDQTNSGATNTVNSQATGNVTTTIASEIIFSAATAYSNFQELPATWTQSGGWTKQNQLDDENDGASMLSSIVSTQIVSSTGTYGNTFGATNLGGSPYGGMGAVIAALSFTAGSSSKKIKVTQDVN